MSGRWQRHNGAARVPSTCSCRTRDRAWCRPCRASVFRHAFKCHFRVHIHWYTARPVALQDRHGMKSLIDPIVALAEEAGRAILEVYSTDFRGAKQGRRVAADAGRSCVAPLDRRRSGRADPGYADHLGGIGPPEFRRAQSMATLLAHRPARRHQGVRESQWRVHGEYCAHRESATGTGCGARTRSWQDVRGLRGRRRAVS